MLLALLLLRDISRAVRYLRKNAAELHIDPSRVCCCGFSAGAHLVGSLAVHHADVCLSADPNAKIDNRPDAVILCYPVITAGEFAHKDSFTCLFGENPTPEQLAWASLENHVTAQTPPTFLWQTFTDETVPVDNSILFAKSCRAHGVRCELHLFMENKHGLSLANAEWAENEVTPQALQTMMQTWQTMKMMYAQSSNKLPEIFAPAAQAADIAAFAAEWTKLLSAYHAQNPNKPDPSASQWPNLALAWLEKVIPAASI